MKKIIISLFTAILAISLTACGTANKNTEEKKLKKVDFVLDWAINTNHTGLYVATEKGYIAEEGIDLDIKPAPEDSTSDLIINNKAPFGIYYQDSMAHKLSKGAGITAVAAIIEHNTSGIISLKKNNIKISDIDMVIPHQASIAMPLIMQKLGFDKNKFIDEVKDFGNMVSASVPLTLAHALENKKIKKGDLIFLIGTAAGLTTNMMLIKL